jgi:hypothetical protein
MIKINKTKEEFIKWHDQVINKYNGESVFGISELYDRLKSNHKEIRALIGDVENVYNVKVKTGTNYTKFEDIEQWVSNIEYYLPKYLSQYGLKRAIFLEDRVGKVKLNKHVLTYADEVFKKTKDGYITDNYGAVLGTPEAIVFRIKTYLDKISIIKKSNVIKEDNAFVKISTALEAFVMLGHYGPDTGSCFGFGKERYTNKYRLAHRKNTFVCLISREKDFAKPIARCWGWLDGKALCFSNLYHKTSNEKSVTALLTECCKQIYKKETVHYESHIADVEDGVYSNNDNKVFHYDLKELDGNYTLERERPEPCGDTLD